MKSKKENFTQSNIKDGDVELDDKAEEGIVSWGKKWRDGTENGTGTNTGNSTYLVQTASRYALL